ncbi:hypothetical protein DVH24_026442 [Malus domestica]|uniref:RNase H type-1 domain-containing protein n=1 Tax=Malus domestica TaxID=3750 RepID=A0A498KIR0_MALDO|nr:hypothetical protein DVH24_026442 [Malus domestica]
MANGGRDHAVIPIPAVNHIQTTTSLDRRVEEPKWLLHPSAGNSSCCIFRMPQHLLEINEKAYQPDIVSIGPYHYSDMRVEMMQQHKRRFLRDLLARTPSNGRRLDHYRQVVASMEESIRGCYSETIDLSSHDLVEIMVLDGLFTVELFCKVGRKSPSDPDDLASLSPSDPDDPIFNLAWVFPNLIRDLLRLENQIPFFVLQKLFDESKASREDSESSLAKLALEFFNHAVERTDISTTEEKHLLDLLRLSFIPKPYDQSPQGQARNIRPLVQLIRSAKKPLQGTRKAVKKFVAGIKSKTRKGNTSASIEFIQSAEKLHLAGIKFKTRDAMSILDIRFCKGVLEIPHIVLDDLRTVLFINFVAFEQCHYFHCSKHVTTYAAFMSCLIRTPADVSFLCDKTIIENRLGSNEEAADFFKNLGKDYVKFNVDASWVNATNTGYTGVVARDSSGTFIAARRSSIDAPSAAAAEAVAIRHGCELGVALGGRLFQR